MLTDEQLSDLFFDHGHHEFDLAIAELKIYNDRERTLSFARAIRRTNSSWSIYA